MTVWANAPDEAITSAADAAPEYRYPRYLLRMKTDAPLLTRADIYFAQQPAFRGRVKRPLIAPTLCDRIGNGSVLKRRGQPFQQTS